MKNLHRFPFLILPPFGCKTAVLPLQTADTRAPLKICHAFTTPV
jgi:hypothetical protein